MARSVPRWARPGSLLGDHVNRVGHSAAQDRHINRVIADAGHAGTKVEQSEPFRLVRSCFRIYVVALVKVSTSSCTKANLFMTVETLTGPQPNPEDSLTCV